MDSMGYVEYGFELILRFTHRGPFLARCTSKIYIDQSHTHSGAITNVKKIPTRRATRNVTPLVALKKQKRENNKKWKWTNIFKIYLYFLRLRFGSNRAGRAGGRRHTVVTART
jgi:hypothetical protein